MLELVDLRHEYPLARGWFDRRTLVAVDNVTLAAPLGQTVAIVGESGSGKTTLGRCVAGLLRPSAGHIRLDGVDLLNLTGAARRHYRRKVQMVFQDPGESLNPRMTVAATLSEPLRRWHGLTGAALRHRLEELLAQVQLSPALLPAHPHQLSGGQQQRVGIARALAAAPDVIVLDEPTSALDVSVQAQILTLLVDLQQQLGMTYLLISHDLATVRYLAQRVVVLYLGRVVEQGDVAAIFSAPQHPYTRALLGAAPRLTAYAADARRERLQLRGEVGNPLEVGAGCALAPRCPLVQPDCLTTPQRLKPVAATVTPGVETHRVACQVVTQGEQVGARP
jgi:oligopeptide/dipeptide ABC transporter ATP-binding protein